MLCDFDQIRRAQEHRILESRNSWDEAKTQLKNAIALTENREREYQGVCADARSKLDALDLVIGLAKGLGSEVPEEKRSHAAEDPRAIRIVPEAASGEVRTTDNREPPSRALGGLVRRSSRPLFSSLQRSA